MDSATKRAVLTRSVSIVLQFLVAFVGFYLLSRWWNTGDDSWQGAAVFALILVVLTQSTDLIRWVWRNRKADRTARR